MIKLVELDLPFPNNKELEIWPKSLADIGVLSLTLTMKTSFVDFGSSNYWNQIIISGLSFGFYLLTKFWLWLDLVNYGWLSSNSILLLLKTSFNSK